MPGVTYDRSVLFTPHGVVVLHVITAPRPGGLYTLAPVLARGTLTGGLEPRHADRTRRFGGGDDGRDRGRLRPRRRQAERHLVERRAARSAAAREPQLDRHRRGRDAARRPREAVRHLAGDRPAAHAVRPQRAARAGADCALHRRVRPAHAHRRGCRRSGARVVPGDRAEHRPRRHGHGDRVRRRRADPDRRCRADGRGRGGGEAAGGSADRDDDPSAARSAAELGRRDCRARWRPRARPEREGGVPLARGLHERAARLPHRARARSASSRTAACVLVAVDGGRPGYSAGLTSFELAQALVRLGAVTAAGVDPGDSVTAAFDGRLLNRPSGRSERAVKEALLVQYFGVYAPEPPLPLLTGEPGLDGRAAVLQGRPPLDRDGHARSAPTARSIRSRPRVAARRRGPTRFTASTFDQEGTWRWDVSADRRPRPDVDDRAHVPIRHDAARRLPSRDRRAVGSRRASRSRAPRR